jgi:signal transduction histidine kinase
MALPLIADTPEDDLFPLEKGQRVNILVVDDLPEKLLVYRTILDELGQNVVTARGGEEALKMVLAHEFAVILLDVNMPDIDGFETATLIRQRRKSARTPIIFLTAFTDESHVSQGYASGAVDYLSTPVIPEVLRAKVRVFIELSQMRQKAALRAEERARRQAAEEADRRKDEFLGMLAHELRNPLGPIRNAIHLLQAAGPQEPRCIQLRDIIDRQVTHMARLVDDLLDSTRLARGQVLLRTERCDLARLVRQTALDYGSVFEASGIDMRVDTPEEPLWADCDPTRISQMVGNLLHNAHKFTNPGGAVSVSLRHENGEAFICVRDTGIGIDAETLPWIFDVFRQGEQGLDRKKGGLGLGLALVKGLTGLHGGTVSAESAGPGRGAAVTIRLPAPPRAPVANMNDDPPAPCGVSPWRILIIEDNIDTAETLSQVLTAEGHDVRVAYSGVDGLEAARGFLPHVVLCDIGLPGLDGYQVVRGIRQNLATASAYIVALTGYGRDEDRQEAKKAGFDMHLTKPVNHNSLRRVIGYMPVRGSALETSA